MEKIIGIGMDAVESRRVLLAMQKKSFLEKYYSAEEQAGIRKRSGRAATNFAGKEAVAKSFGTGFRKISPKEIEILRNEKNAPYVRLSGCAQKKAVELGITKIHISLSDTDDMAYAYVIAVGDEN